MKKIETLAETAALMSSNDYKERFIAEYAQLEIRLDKLTAMLEKLDKGELNFTPICPREVFNEQISGMVSYLNALRNRAEIEGIDISGGGEE